MCFFLFFSQYTGRDIGTNVVAGVSGVFGGIHARDRSSFFNEFKFRSIRRGEI